MPRPPVRHAVLLLAIAVCGGAGASTQGRSGAPSREIRTEDWALSSWSAIRAGQLSVVHLRNGDELRVNALTTVTKPAAPAHDRGVAPACDGNCFLVSAFDYGNANALGGCFGTFGRGDSRARASLDTWDDGRRALTIDFLNGQSGSSGVWIDFFDLNRPPADRVYLDASPFDAVTFWIRGRQGGEIVLLKAADAVWERREDALPLGDAGSFLAAGRITTSWQQAVVPLAMLPARIDRRTLALLAFEAASPGDARIAVKDLAFCLEPRPTLSLSPPAPPQLARPPHDRALWIWNTADILADSAAEGALVEFARRNLVTVLYLQLPNEVPRRGSSGEIRLDASKWRTFLRRLNENGLSAHALSGSPEDALPDHHGHVLATVDSVTAYNASVAPGERFAGLHFDVEPYLLPGFRGARRQQIMSGYLDLVARTAARVRPAGIEFGVDIPFWYDAPDDLTGELPVVEYHGTRRAASEHILDLVDSVTVMTYRTAAYGADSIAALSDGELRYGARAGKRVFIGLETTELPDEDLLEFEGEPRRGLPALAPADRTVVIDRGTGTATVWAGSSAGWQHLRARLDARQPGPTAAPPLWWPVRRVIAVPASKLTFARLDAARLDETMRQALPELTRRPSFAGFAIHDYLGYRALLGGSGPTR